MRDNKEIVRGDSTTVRRQYRNDKDKEIRINPKSDLEILRAWVKQRKKSGKTPSAYKIGKLVNRQQTTIKDALNRLERDYPRMRQFMKDVRKTGYFTEIHVHHAASLSKKKLEQAARDGFYVGGNRPKGYLKETESAISTLKPHPEEFPMVWRLIKGYYVDGKSTTQLSREENLTESQVYNIVVLNVRFYAGYVRYKKWYKGKHKPVISPEFWRTYIQPVLEAPKAPYHRRRPRGLMRKLGGLVRDPAEAPRIEKIFDLAFDDKGISEIARHPKVKLAYMSVKWILNNPIYANKIRIPGKPPDEWPDAGVEPLISFKKWLAVQKKLRARTAHRSPLELARVARMKRAADMKEDIRVYIIENERTTKQISKHFKLNIHTVKNYLRVLQKKGKIGKRGPLDKLGRPLGKWYSLKNEKGE